MLGYNLFSRSICGFCGFRPHFLHSFQNWFRPVTTGFWRFFPVLVPVFGFWESHGPVRSSVRAQKGSEPGPDRTFKHYILAVNIVNEEAFSQSLAVEIETITN